MGTLFLELASICNGILISRFRIVIIIKHCIHIRIIDSSLLLDLAGVVVNGVNVWLCIYFV